MNIKALYNFKKMLGNLDNCMKKASAYADTKKFDVNILVSSRLAPDMFHFGKQVQSVCDTAKFTAAYLTGKTAPKHEDNETTWTELHERIQKVLTYLNTFTDGDFANASTTKVSPRWAEGKWLHADEYLNEVAIPNFYFHLMTCYAILRHSGVDIGKMDYLGKVDMKS